MTEEKFESILRRLAEEVAHTEDRQLEVKGQRAGDQFAARAVPVPMGSYVTAPAVPTPERNDLVAALFALLRGDRAGLAIAASILVRPATKEHAAVGGICEGRVVIVTGAGRGHRPRPRARVRPAGRQGRGQRPRRRARRHAARRPGPPARSSTPSGPRAGEAVANGDDVADWDGAQRLVADRGRRVRRPRRAGEQRRVPARPHGRDHVRGGVGRGHPGPPEGPLRPTRFAADVLAGAAARRARPSTPGSINTSSGAGLMGSVGQGTYSAAKAGIAALTLVESAELGRYGVTANAIAPVGPHPHDRGGLRRHDGRARRRLRRDGTRERVAARRLARQRRVRAASPGGCSRSRAGCSRSPTAGSTARRSTRAPAGTRRRWARPSATCWPRPHPRRLPSTALQ